MQTRRTFRPKAPSMDALWKKPPPSSRGGLPTRPNVRVAAADLASVSKAQKVATARQSETPTPPPTTVAAAAPASERGDKPSLGRIRRQRRAKLQWAAFVTSAAIAFVVCSFSGSTTTLRRAPARATAALEDFFSRAAARFADTVREAKAASADTAEAAPPPAPPAENMKINRAGHVSLPGGILVFPSSFQTSDGSYDLLIHFHGNTAVVKESAEVAKLNAAVAIINVGVGSGPYETYYAQPGTYEDLLTAIDHGLRQRGVENAHVRRIAFSGWSAGYGAISTILHVRKKNDPLDAILLLDGIHCSWEGASSAAFSNEIDVNNLSPELVAARASGAINKRQMASFLDAAKDAVDGRIFFGITHTQIDPITYASTAVASSYLVHAVGAERVPLDPVKDAPPYVELESMATAVDHSKEKHMEPISEARKGGFHVIGYKGETQEHHMAHLFEMSQTLLPELVTRWSK